MTLLALETSCDETSAAVVRDGVVLANVVSSQIKMHEEYGGVVPELAAREHLKNLIPVVNAALAGAGVGIAQLDAVAATQGPGLGGALMIGFKAAQAMAFVLGKPFLGVHHHEAHLYSPWIQNISPSPLQGERAGLRGSSMVGLPNANITPNEPADPSPSIPLPLEGRGKPDFAANFSAFQPNVSLIVSGGHTMLVHVAGEFQHRVLGGTIDDAAGECFDKTGKLIGLPYPAGPVIDRLAERGNAKAYDFPRPLLHDASDDFSFSGLKTSVRYFVRDNPDLLNDDQKIRDLCASTQAAIVEVLVTKTIRAAKRLGVRCVTASGGVICNRSLRAELAKACEKNRFTLRLAETRFSTDNAAMIGIVAERKLARGLPATSFDAEVVPNWTLA